MGGPIPWTLACGTVVGLHQALGLLLGAGLFNFAMDDARSGVGSRAADWEGGVWGC